MHAASSIVKKGLDKAAESLSFFIKDDVKMRPIDIKINKISELNKYTNKEGEQIHFLITDVIGDMKGVCYLIFSKNEADKLRSLALPTEVLNNESLMQEMADAIMLEVDNIISASVITQFANILQVHIYGGVPRLKKFNYTELNDYVKQNSNTELFSINIKAHFETSLHDFNPEFIWQFEGTFLDNIRKLSEKEYAEANYSIN